MLEDRDRAAWVAEAEGAAIGYATVRRAVAAAGVIGSKPAELQRIHADHGYHGTGLGRRLPETCIAQAHTWGGDVLRLGVWERNLRAIAFHEKGGFGLAGSHAFVGGTDVQRDVVMSLPLR